MPLAKRCARAVRFPANDRVLGYRAMRVLYVVHGFPPETWAGVEVYTLNLARAMQARGHEVAVLARTPGRSGPAAAPEGALLEERFQDLRVLRLVRRLDFSRFAESYHDPGVERVFGELLDRERPDVVHFQHLIHFSAGCVDVARERGIATVITCHDYWAVCARVQMIRPDGVRCRENMGLGCALCLKQRRYSLIGAAKRWLPHLLPPARPILGRRLRVFEDVLARQPYVLGTYSRADLLISPSRFLRDKLLATGRLDPERLLFSAYGMPAERLGARAKEPDAGGALRLAFVGSLVWYKGVEVLVRAMRRLAGRPVRLSIHGDFRPERESYHARLAELARGARVEFRGPFANERLAEVHRGIDVLVVPSLWYENAPLTIQEAFLSRTPVVTSDLGGMAELVQDGAGGLLFPAGDAQGLAAVIERFLAEPGLAPELAARAPKVKTMAENAAELERRYAGLTGPKPVP